MKTRKIYQNIWGNGLPVASQINVKVWAVGNRGLISMLSRLITGGTANNICDYWTFWFVRK